MTKSEKNKFRNFSVAFVRKAIRSGMTWDRVRLEFESYMREVASEQRVIFNDIAIQVFREDVWNS